MTIAALYVRKGGPYFDIEGVDPWDEQRDARLYGGPFPVVAHPPCSRWCRLAGLVEKRWGHKKGDDGGTFVAALNSVRAYGGVLEHPAYSDAWLAHDLLAPPTGGGWVNADFFGGWVCYVEQWRYGHPAKKATWLYAKGVDLPSLKWGAIADQEYEGEFSWARAENERAKETRAKLAVVSFCGNNAPSNAPSSTFAGAGEARPRLGKLAALSTPAAFRDVLIAMARSAERKP